MGEWKMYFWHRKLQCLPWARDASGLCRPGVRQSWREWEELRLNGENMALLSKVVRLKMKLSQWKQTKHVCRHNFVDSVAIKEEDEVREALILGAKFNGGTKTQ